MCMYKFNNRYTKIKNNQLGKFNIFTKGLGNANSVLIDIWI